MVLQLKMYYCKCKNDEKEAQRSSIRIQTNNGVNPKGRQISSPKKPPKTKTNTNKQNQQKVRKHTKQNFCKNLHNFCKKSQMFVQKS